MRVVTLLLILLASSNASAIQYQCFVDEECAIDEYCSEHRCHKFSEGESMAMSRVPECWSDSDCDFGQTCDMGICAGNWPC